MNDGHYDGVESIEISVSTDPTFPSETPQSEIKKFNLIDARNQSLAVPTRDGSDIRHTAHFVRVRCIGKTTDSTSGRPGAWSVPSPGWLTAGSLGAAADNGACIDASEYLNTASLDPRKWSCAQCPVGASCQKSITWSSVKAKFGYARCSDGATFVRCQGRACLGAPNNALENMFRLSNGRDPATMDHNESCALGHVNPPTNNMRCAECADGYVPTFGSGEVGACRRCTKGGSTLFLVLAFLASAIVFAVLVGLRMKSRRGRKSAHSTIKRTGFTHLQTIGIVLSLNVEWPLSVRAVLNFFSGFVSISSHSDSLHCSTGTKSSVELFFALQTASVLAPILVAAVAWIFWFVCVPRHPKLGCERKRLRTPVQRCPWSSSSRRETGNALPRHAAHQAAAHSATSSWKSTYDGWMLTNVFFIYLTFPSILRMALGSLQCRELCGEWYLALGDGEKCLSARHVTFIITSAVPGLVLYILVLPALLALHLSRNSAKMQTDPRLLLRFGLVYSGFSRKRWYWELVVIARKILMTLIIIFASANTLQLNLMLGVLIFFLYVQERARPFEDKEAIVPRRSGAGASTGTDSDGANGEETNDGDGGDGAGQKQLHQQKQFHLIEATSLIVLVTMVWAASLFAQSKSTCGNSEWACVILSIVVFVSNIIFVVACFFIACTAFRKRHNTTIKNFSKQMVSARVRLSDRVSSFARSVRRPTGERNRGHGAATQGRGAVGGHSQSTSTVELDMPSAGIELQVNPFSREGREEGGQGEPTGGEEKVVMVPDTSDAGGTGGGGETNQHFVRHLTKKGDSFYVPASGASKAVWELPKGADVVEEDE